MDSKVASIKSQLLSFVNLFASSSPSAWLFGLGLLKVTFRHHLFARLCRMTLFGSEMFKNFYLGLSFFIKLSFTNCKINAFLNGIFPKRLRFFIKKWAKWSLISAYQYQLSKIKFLRSKNRNLNKCLVIKINQSY